MQIAKPGADVGIITKDASVLRPFYEEALGLPFLGTVPLPTGTLHVFACGDTLLKFYEIPEARAPTTAPAFGEQTGIAYVTVNVGDIDEVVQRLNEHGVEPAAPVVEFDAGVTLPEPVGRVRARVTLVADPDGNTIELLQRT